MSTIKADIKSIQNITYEAYKTSGQILALLDNRNNEPNAVANALEKMSAQFEYGVISLRNLCEKNHPSNTQYGVKSTLPHINVAGSVQVNEYGWLHIALNTLLPNCRFQSPAYLMDTITRLLDDYERGGGKLPRFDSAMLVIDEHCDIESQTVFDPDNKGWKAIPNVLKGRVIKDDDQFSISIALISTKSEEPACHIYLFPQLEAGDFFYLKHENYPIFP